MALSRRAPVWLDAQQPLREWYASALGQSILDNLETCLASRLADIFGYQGLQIGNPAPGRKLFNCAGLHRRLTLDAPGCHADHAVDLIGDVRELPIATDTMKLVLFLHTLDFCDAPHQALREANRVLTDDGHLVVVGFNPVSIFGLRHALTGWRGRTPWNGHFYSQRRITDWLSVLDYRVLHTQTLFIRPPLNSPRLQRRISGLEKLQPWLQAFGGLYVLQARKQTLPMTLSRTQWRRQPAAGISVGSFARSAGRAAVQRESEVNE